MADHGPCTSPLTVVFADDNYLVREGVAALMADVPEIDLVELQHRDDLQIRGSRTVTLARRP
jgi:hypothetical protein